MTRDALRLHGLHKRFGATEAVRGLTLEVPAGSMTVLLGPAGAGKTTTLKMIAGLEIADAGRIEIAGLDLTTAEPKDRNVAMIFDNLALYPNRTGFGNIAYPLQVARLAPEVIEQRVRALAGMLRITHVLGRLPKTMSGGERQRVALGRALIRDPAVFLLDEPLSSLDAMLRIDLRAELRRLQREAGHSFFLATPDFAEALALADTVVLLRAGQVVQVAPPQVLYDYPADLEAARFVGAPQINLLPARAEGAELTINATRLACPGFRDAGRGAIVLGIRPEHVIVAPPGQGQMTGFVTDLEPLGHQIALTLDTPVGELRATGPAEVFAPLADQDPVGIRLHGPGLLAFDPDSERLLTPTPTH
ncbi:ATP-binding cassette domain-containing protein [Pseudooceanicola sp. GBMRC 2024]|uniref:ATP-binding cassette domain-containing protein n=2 Tax=Pseudooceanicola albus TaxID=2692189 RepID=A0A6L7G314_9RHOB|nr:ATP-binding cassette domain-containing protein [Pseudooceanicola albus]